MDLKIITDLKSFEENQETKLQKDKVAFDKTLQSRKKKKIEKYQQQLFTLSQEKHDGIQESVKKAQADAKGEAKTYQEKTSSLKSKAKGKVKAAVESVFSEFLNV